MTLFDTFERLNKAEGGRVRDLWTSDHLLILTGELELVKWNCQ